MRVTPACRPGFARASEPCGFSSSPRRPLGSSLVEPRMRDVEAAPVCSRPEPTRTESPIRALTFGGDPAFQRVLRERVAAYFATTGRRPRDCWQVYAKTAI